ncbi:hypothetical protein UFOVP221_15 [uncultured Caudovirales phage]|uniref:Uncharacterized protein n=1 Tax=uncultured Caudovirales phage TaxID=2100421 RepID=A0A6J7WQK9_9CAUD|nr:hypothetical protein UFOVP221_15 [uncultured Caudovirales phage]
MSESYATSYFSAPASTLDPELFEGRNLKSWVRTGILTLLYDFLNKYYRHPELWAHTWLAGSGVSYQWAAARQPGDLDCLIGINYVQFRKANPEFAGLSDTEISQHLNEGFRSDLQPGTENWNGYELTFYVNPGATDIRTINPYAAYDVTYNEWTVVPDPSAHAPQVPEWDVVAQSDYAMAKQVGLRFSQALQDAQYSHNDANRRNAETRLMNSLQQGNALFDEIHHNRTFAFSTGGEGYADFHNYRWQAGKGLGTIQKLRQIRDYANNLRTQKESSTYGVELPSSDTLIRRAALYGRA